MLLYLFSSINFQTFRLLLDKTYLMSLPTFAKTQRQISFNYKYIHLTYKQKPHMFKKYNFFRKIKMQLQIKSSEKCKSDYIASQKLINILGNVLSFQF